jgi:2-polyprenyl-6-hydroxyphenyl methylase/3-demethylubiquinone-9 3-methyltransferase
VGRDRSHGAPAQAQPDPAWLHPAAGLRALPPRAGRPATACRAREPLARLGAAVTGIDLAPANLAVAARHAAAAGLAITYREIAVEELAESGARFDLLCVMEVVEHVPDMPAFLAACGRLVRPGGGLVLATLNRTFRSFALGIVAAEYVLGWLPRGTHRWSRFVRPSEAARALRRAGLSVAGLTGVSYEPLRDRFRLSPDPAVNYMLFAVRD